MPPPPPRPVPTLFDPAPPPPRSPLAAPRPPEARPTRRQARELAALRLIVERLEAAGVVHWIDCGTALGAYRHGGFIPWDHDIDLAIPTEEHARARVALADLGAHGVRAEDWSSYARPETFIKVRVAATHNFIDLYHHTLDPGAGTLAYDFTFAQSPIPASWKRGELAYTAPIPLDVIFPLRRARFEDLVVWAPRDLEAYLELKYGPDLGPTRRWDPRRRAWRRVDDHPYWRRSR
ncbi:MAG: LicD family protein [Deltaproteobacteria bacterium]|nr:LicD family protein [Deltaproteobacteria bacterium]